MLYLTSYVDGISNVETLDGLSETTLDYFEKIYKKYC